MTAITLREALGRSVSFDEVAEAIVACWGLGEALAAAGPVAAAPSRFGSPDWIWRR